ncbi:MAG: hypothetical protein EBZ78_02250 [Verrucomicrobia bacterium]|jgi:hypothetical protein|nr:hypothetical protein [Verrucomicrobiota bacterium]
MDSELMLENVERLREFEPFVWYREVMGKALSKMANLCLDSSVTQEERERRFQQYVGASTLDRIFDEMDKGLRLGLAQKKKAEDAK